MKKIINLAGYIGLLFIGLILVITLVYFAGLSIIGGNNANSQNDGPNTVSGVISQVTGNGLTVTDFTGEDYDLLLTEGVVVEKMDPFLMFSSEVTVSDLKEGDSVGVFYESVDGKSMAEKISITPPIMVYGQVKEIKPDSFVVNSNNVDYTVKINADTNMMKILSEGKTQMGLRLEDIKVGDTVSVISTYDNDSKATEFTAASVNVISY